MTGEIGYYKGNGGWAIGNNDREILHIIPLDPFSEDTPYGGVVYWYRDEVEVVRKLEEVK